MSKGLEFCTLGASLASPLVLTLLLGEAGIEQGLKERKKLNGWGDEAVLSAQD